MSVGKVAVVTGGNKGIGFAIVRALCKGFDGTVYLTARDEARGKQAVEDLSKEGLSPKFQQLDVDSLESIQRFRDYIKQTHGGLDVLVNNAAIAYKNAATEPFSEQAEVTNRLTFLPSWTFAMNFSHCCGRTQGWCMFPVPQNRVLFTFTGHLFKISGQEPQAGELRKTLADPNLTTAKLIELIKSFVSLTKEGNHYAHGWPNSAYAVSKVAVSALTRIHQREMDQARPNDNILINAVHPGYVDTDMTSHKGPLTIDQGAVAPSWLALLPPSVTEPRGGYVWFNKEITDWVNGPVPS